ncbi:hypothetical protein C8R44DRAFT_891111 [Mycena epipterygia]|nr:hypothetical protein C8R44DRAFT_891111 [Mycena epipterygia]
MAEGGPATQIKELLRNALEKPKPQASSSSGPYQQKPSLQNAFVLGGQSAIFGLFLVGLRNALSGQNLGFVAPIGLFTAVGATFAMTESVVANHRQTDDPVNSASGACAAGFLLGLRSRSLPLALGSCTIMGGMMGMFDYTAGSRGSRPDKQPFFKSTAVVEAVKA